MTIQLFELSPQLDERGEFTKYISKYALEKAKEFKQISEVYTSTSSQFVLRGMHFQHGRNRMSRFVWVSSGEIDDVVVDLRSGSTFGQVHRNILSKQGNTMIFIPWYFAHGFQVISKMATVNYVTDADYSQKEESGIKFDTINFQWSSKPSKVSPRDLSFPALKDFPGVNIV